MTEKDVISKN